MFIKPGIHSLRATRGRVGDDGHRYLPVHVSSDAKDTLRLEFAYDEWLKNQIKSMEGSKWDKEAKCWRIADTTRNAFTFAYLEEGANDPYERYDRELPLVEWPERCDKKVFKQQREMLTEILGRRRVLLAAEMGTGKTLAVIEAMERVKPTWPLYVAPKYVLQAIKREFRMWNAHVMPEFMSYDAVKSMVANWPSGKIAPDFIVFDESHNLKTPTSQRSFWCKALADGARRDHKDPYIVCLTGTPAPKSPLDWWMQCEVVCPGFIKESSVTSMNYRLALIVKQKTMAGGSYPERVTWYDDERKCKECGKYFDDVEHTAMGINYHRFVQSENELEKLYRRLKGLVYIKFKRDCLDLPEKIYRRIVLEQTPSALRAMKLITKRCPTVIEALTLTRELSDGFQYQLVADGKVVCERCGGSGDTKEPMIMVDGPEANVSPDQEMVAVTCPNCAGTGQVDKMVNKAVECPTPKDDALLELLQENEDIGRLVVYCGFTASVDRVCQLVIRNGWDVLRVDGRGQWTSFDFGDPKICSVCGQTEGAPEHHNMHPQFHAFQPHSALAYFQNKANDKKIVFIGQAEAAGVGITLTAASMIVYYSNSFSGTSRMQSEDRIHRPGMDTNRGATIVDLLWLPTDEYVLENLEKKRTLQSQTLGDLQNYLEAKEQQSCQM